MDSIRLKLQLIDNARQSPYQAVSKSLAINPLLIPASGIIVGIIIQNLFELSIYVPVILSIAGALSFAFAIKSNAKEHTKTILVWLAVLICFMSLGMFRLKNHQTLPANHISNFLPAERTLATISGHIITEPRQQRRDNWQFAIFQHSDPGTAFLLNAAEIKTQQKFVPTQGRIMVYVGEPTLDLKQGQLIEFDCWLGGFGPAQNPGQFDIKTHYQRKNILAAASVETCQSITILKNPPTNKLSNLKLKIRSVASEALLGTIDPQDETSALLEALLLGNRKNIPPDTITAFLRTGLLHFISLSGLHLGILLSFVWMLLNPLGISKRRRAFICLLTIILFLVVVPARPPTVRAAIIASFICLAIIVRRNTSPLNALSLAAIAILLCCPVDIFNIGFQLSFGCVLGIILLSDSIKNILLIKLHLLGEKRNWIISIGHKLIVFFATGVSAWLGGAGILLYHFYAINPLMVLWTILIFPLIAAILAIGLLKIIIAAIFPTLAKLIAFVLTGLITLLVNIVKALADIAPGEILIGAVPIFIVIAFYILLLFFANPWLGNGKWRKKIIIALAVIVILPIASIKYTRMYPDKLKLSCLAVGAGQAILLQSPEKTYLFDAGSISHSNVGNKIIVPFLRYNGISRIDRIFVSHADIDHFNALPETIRNYPVDAVSTNKAFLVSLEKSSTAKFLKKSLSQHNVGIKILEKTLPDNSADISIIWPTDEICDDPIISKNDKSQVSLIEFAGRKILLCSDIEKFAQQKIMEMYPYLNIDIVVIPHHGSINTLSEKFITGLEPKITVSSCSQSQFLRQSQKELAGIETCYTARYGCIEIEIEQDGKIELQKYRQ